MLIPLLVVLPLVSAVKFHLPAYRTPAPKCIWNPVHDGDLVIVTANVEKLTVAADTPNQRVDIEIVDSSPHKNVYLSKKNLVGESRLAVTSHAEGEIGVCLRNTLDIIGVSGREDGSMSRIVDLDVDIGVDAVDYNAIANQESLSTLETEMRKIEGQVSAIVEELGYLKTREERFSQTNESTNARVQNFAWFTIISLLLVGIYQIVHLRAFFKRKYLID